MPRASANFRNPRRRVSARQAILGLAGLGQAALSASQIAQYAANAGFSGNDLVTAVAIALAESGGIPDGAPGDQSLAPSNGPSYGLWQINIGTKANPQFASWNLTDPQTNANAAYEIYSAWGNTFGAWSTYTSGKYAAYLSTAAGASPTAPEPLTIDASTGLPVVDTTPTPSSGVSLDPGTALVLAAGAVGVYIVARLVSDL